MVVLEEVVGMWLVVPQLGTVGGHLVDGGGNHLPLLHLHYLEHLLECVEGLVD